MGATRQVVLAWMVLQALACGIGASPPASGEAGAIAAPNLPTTVTLDPNAVIGAAAGGGSLPDISPPPFDPNMWLTTQSKAQNPNAVPGIYSADRRRFDNRGPVVPDPRACDTCAWLAATPWETLARVDLAIDTWHANFIHLALESHTSATVGQSSAAQPRVSWESVLFDPAYLQSLVDIVNHIGHKSGAYVLLSLVQDQSFTADGRQFPSIDSFSSPGSLCPSFYAGHVATTNCVWQKLAQTFAAYPSVLFGLDAEPAGTTSGDDNELLMRYDAVARTVRDVELAAGTPPHVLVLSGTQGFGRTLSYYAQTVGGSPNYHLPSTGGGANVAFSSQPFSAAADFNTLFVDAAQYLPILIGDFGPLQGSAMTLADARSLFDMAVQNGWPLAARAMAPNCNSSVDMLSFAEGQSPQNLCDGSDAGKFTYTPWGNAFLINLINANP